MRNQHPVYKLIGKKVTLRASEASSYWRAKGELICFTREAIPYPIIGIENDTTTIKFDGKEVVDIQELSSGEIVVFLK